MNEVENEQLLSLACEAFENSTGLAAHSTAYSGPQIKAVSRETGRLEPHQINKRLQIGPQGLPFLVETSAKRQVDQIELWQAGSVNHKAGEPVVLVVPYVSDRQGEKLRRYGIQYLDTAGNAWLYKADGTFFVLVKGQRQPLAKQLVQHRAFQPAGVQLLYQLLSEPALLQANYRTMAQQAQVSLGSVSILLRGLQQLGMLRDESGKRRWTEPAQVLRRWVDAYGEVMRPRLAVQRYRWLDSAVARQGWQNLELSDNMAWGGEPAAHLLLDGYLLPEYFTLYTTATRGEVMRQLRLVPDANGKVEVVKPMKTVLAAERIRPQVVHPLLAYADLLSTSDPRNREAAQQLHEHYLSYLA